MIRHITMHSQHLTFVDLIQHQQKQKHMTTRHSTSKHRF